MFTLQSSIQVQQGFLFPLKKAKIVLRLSVSCILSEKVIWFFIINSRPGHVKSCYELVFVSFYTGGILQLASQEKQGFKLNTLEVVFFLWDKWLHQRDVLFEKWYPVMCTFEGETLLLHIEYRNNLKCIFTGYGFCTNNIRTKVPFPHFLLRFLNHCKVFFPFCV